MNYENNIKRYGDISSEKTAQKISECRQIAKAISDFGVDDNQVVSIIKLLALQIENQDLFLKLNDMLKEIDAGYSFVEGRIIDGT